MASQIYGLIEVSGLADPNTLPTNHQNFKQFSVQETLTIPEAKPDVEQIVSVMAEVVIKETRVITTPIGTSRENQILTGRKLIVEGAVVQKVEYVADEPTQKVHAAHFVMPFSTFIVMPTGFEAGTRLKVTGYIEDIYIQQLDKRTIFKNVTILLDAVREV